MKFSEKYDVIIVGGGPAGCIAAKECAEKGLSVLLLERHREIGIPVRCGEAVGKAGLLEFFDNDHPIVKKYVRKFEIRFVAPDGTVLDIEHGSEAAVLDRKIFDAELGRLASVAGARIITAANVTGLIIKEGFVKGVKFESGGIVFEIRSEIVIGADGIESRVGRWAGMNTSPAFSDLESCAQYTVSGGGFDPGRLEFHFGKNVAPTGYLWVFPKHDGNANIGLGVNGPCSKIKKASAYLNGFMEKNHPGVSILNRTCGGVICSKTLEKISGDGFMLVGDAAHQTNAVSGGGIVNAMKAGRIAAATAVNAIRSGDVSSSRLNNYDKQWYVQQGKMNKKFYQIKTIIENIDDTVLNTIAGKLSKKPKEKRTLVRIFTLVLFEHPKLILELPSLFS